MIQGDSPPTIEDFDKKLSETDCYLQILLNQVAALKVKIGKFMLVVFTVKLFSKPQILKALHQEFEFSALSHGFAS